MSFLSNLDWRYATKKFDSSKTVAKELETKILEAARLAPTSYGLQPFHISVITDPAIKAELKGAGYGQDQFVAAPVIFVFSARTDLSERVDAYIKLATGGDAEVQALMQGYFDMMRGSATSLTPDAAKAWTSKQAYIALGFALAAAAELEVDAAPMEGFDNDAFKKILNLPEHFHPVVTMAIGYRSSDDTIRPKTRFPADDIVDYR